MFGPFGLDNCWALVNERYPLWGLCYIVVYLLLLRNGHYHTCMTHMMRPYCCKLEALDQQSLLLLFFSLFRIQEHVICCCFPIWVYYLFCLGPLMHNEFWICKRTGPIDRGLLLGSWGLAIIANNAAALLIYIESRCQAISYPMLKYSLNAVLEKRRT